VPADATQIYVECDEGKMSYSCKFIKSPWNISAT